LPILSKNIVCRLTFIMSELTVVLNCECVGTGMAEKHIQTYQEQGFTVVRRKKVQLSRDLAATFILPEAGQTTESDEHKKRVDSFSSGASLVLLLSRDNAFVEFASIGDDQAYGSALAWSALRDRRNLWPGPIALERACAVVLPGFSEMDMDAILGALDRNDFVVVHRESRTLNAQQAQTIFHFNSDSAALAASGECVVLVLEKIDAVAELNLLLGPANPEQANLVAPDSLRARFGDNEVHNAIYGSRSRSDFETEYSVLFSAPLAVERTLAMLKPDAMLAGSRDDILAEIARNGFTVLAQETVHMSKQRAEEFYAEHQAKPFFAGLVNFMSSGPITALVLSKAAAIKSWRKLMGPTNSFAAKETKPTSLRARFGTNGQKNAVHGSDSVESAEREIRFHFPQMPRATLPEQDKVRAMLSRKPDVHPGSQEKHTLNSILVQGLTELCKEKPRGLAAVEWLGNWLMENNPNQPSVEEPEDVKRELTVAEQLSIRNAHAPVKVVFVIGGPGSGKGTQCARIMDKFGYVHLSSGDLLRAAKASGAEEADVINECQAKGALVPDAVVFSLLEKAMLRSGKTKFLVDGFPRSIGQALQFEERICPCSFVLSFNASDDTLIDRLLNRGKTSGRVDDNEATILKRLQAFHELTVPVVQHFQRFDKVQVIDAEDSVDEVWSEVQKLRF